MRDHVEQATLAGVTHRRHADDRCGLQLPAAHQAQRAGLLGHEQIAVGQERHAPGTGQTFGDCDDAEVLQRGAMHGILRRQRPGELGGEHGGSNERDSGTTDEHDESLGRRDPAIYPEVRLEDCPRGLAMPRDAA